MGAGMEPRMGAEKEAEINSTWHNIVRGDTPSVSINIL